MDPSVFKAYDIRGVYPKDLDEKGVEQITRSIFAFFKKSLKKDNPTVLLARDMRISSPSLFDTAKKVLVACGAHVIDIDLAPTPTFYFAVLKYGADAGITVTASHNPKEYAGVKFVIRSGDKLIKIGKSTGMDEIKEVALAGKFDEYTNDGSVEEKTTALEDEVNDALGLIDASKLKSFKIATDTANGMGALYISKLFEKIPGELTTMNFELDGTFPAHPADPLDFDNLKPLQEKVREIGADLGIEPDGDGDRVFFIDEQGEVVPATFVSALIGKEILAKNKGAKIIADIRYTRNVENAVKKFGGEFLVSRVGHAFITEQVNKEDATFAGESSGHFYFGATGGAESSVRVILYVLMAMSETGKPLSQVLKDLQSSYESGEINFVLPEGSDSKKLMEEIAADHPGSEVSWLDGVSVSYPEWRFNIRASNTEPLIRLNVESQDQSMTKEKFDMLTQRILEAGARKKESGH